MRWRHLLWTCLLLPLARSDSDPHNDNKRVLSRLVGGHLRLDEDTELVTASAGAGRDAKPKRSDQQEEKKTLSQQVADGKYGLIQKELFSKPIKRPGIISYKINTEVPKDNVNTLGGLQKNEIWLAENHLLVLKGGDYPQHDDHNDNGPSIWPPIDDYKAPERQVKIPAHPKVPPPFPVQLTEDGPLQILGTNASRTLNGTYPENAYAVQPPEGYVPGTGPFFFNPSDTYPANATSGETPNTITPHPPAVPGEYRPGDGLSPPFPHPLNGTWPPSFASLPPGAAILPPPDNLTDFYDDDDPSIYYPPPYSFYYPKDNSTTQIKAGPLVPGIILPPPPNFFGPLEDTTTTQKPTKAPQRTVTVTSSVAVTKTKQKVPTTKVHKLVTIVPTYAPRIVVSRNQSYSTTQRRKPPSVTILHPIKSTPAPVYYKDNRKASSPQPFAIYGPPSTTAAPPKGYYSTPKGTPEIGLNLIPKTTVSPQYYYYEEEHSNVKTTPRPRKLQEPKNYYYKDSPPPRVQILSKNNPEENIQVYYVPSTPYVTERPKYQLPEPTDTFSIHIAKLQQHIQSYVTSRPYAKEVRQQANQPSKPVYQYSFEAADYNRPQQQQQQQQRNPKFQQNPQYRFNQRPKYSVQIQPAVEIIPGQFALQSSTVAPPIYYHQPNSGGFVPSNYNPVPYQQQQQQQQQQNNNGQRQFTPQQYTATPRPVAQYTTQNPVYQQQIYTKPEDNYFDDITKQYFTVFGKKLASSTTPLPYPITNRPRFIEQPHKVQQQQQSQYNNNNNINNKPISLETDTLVNYAHPRPPPNPDAEYIGRPQVNDGQRGSYISYQLPGDNAHFYFLTPQLVKRTDQGAGYYYAQPNTTSVLQRDGV